MQAGEQDVFPKKLEMQMVFPHNVVSEKKGIGKKDSGWDACLSGLETQGAVKAVC